MAYHPPVSPGTPQQPISGHYLTHQYSGDHGYKGSEQEAQAEPAAMHPAAHAAARVTLSFPPHGTTTHDNPLAHEEDEREAWEAAAAQNARQGQQKQHNMPQGLEEQYGAEGVSPGWDAAREMPPHHSQRLARHPSQRSLALNQQQGHPQALFAGPHVLEPLDGGDSGSSATFAQSPRSPLADPSNATFDKLQSSNRGAKGKRRSKDQGRAGQQRAGSGQRRGGLLNLFQCFGPGASPTRSLVLYDASCHSPRHNPKGQYSPLGRGQARSDGGAWQQGQEPGEQHLPSSFLLAASAHSPHTPTASQRSAPASGSWAMQQLAPGAGFAFDDYSPHPSGGDAVAHRGAEDFDAPLPRSFGSVHEPSGRISVSQWFRPGCIPEGDQEGQEQQQGSDLGSIRAAAAPLDPQQRRSTPMGHPGQDALAYPSGGGSAAALGARPISLASLAEQAGGQGGALRGLGSYVEDGMPRGSSSGNVAKWLTSNASGPNGVDVGVGDASSGSGGVTSSTYSTYSDEFAASAEGASRAAGGALGGKGYPVGMAAGKGLSSVSSAGNGKLAEQQQGYGGGWDADGAGHRASGIGSDTSSDRAAMLLADMQRLRSSTQQLKQQIGSYSTASKPPSGASRGAAAGGALSSVSSSVRPPLGSFSASQAGGSVGAPGRQSLKQLPPMPLGSSVSGYNGEYPGYGQADGRYSPAASYRPPSGDAESVAGSVLLDEFGNMKKTVSKLQDEVDALHSRVQRNPSAEAVAKMRSTIAELQQARSQRRAVSRQVSTGRSDLGLGSRLGSVEGSGGYPY